MVGTDYGKALLLYYSMLTGQLVTSDTSTYSFGARGRQFHLPVPTGRRSIQISNEDDEMSACLTHYPYRGPVCSIVEEEHGIEFITDGTGSARNASINLHNLNTSLEVGQVIEQMLRREGIDVAEPGGDMVGSDFWNFMKDLTDERVAKDLHRAMCYLRVAFEENLEAAYEQYCVPYAATKGESIESGDFVWIEVSEEIANRKTLKVSEEEAADIRETIEASSEEAPSD